MYAQRHVTFGKFSWLIREYFDWYQPVDKPRTWCDHEVSYVISPGNTLYHTPRAHCLLSPPIRLPGVILCLFKDSLFEKWREIAQVPFCEGPAWHGWYGAVWNFGTQPNEWLKICLKRENRKPVKVRDDLTKVRIQWKLSTGRKWKCSQLKFKWNVYFNLNLARKLSFNFIRVLPVW